MILTLRWFDSNWWHTMIKQSYLYKNILWTCTYYCNQIACTWACVRVSECTVRATRPEHNGNEDSNDIGNTTMVRIGGEKSKHWSTIVRSETAKLTLSIHRLTHTHTHTEVWKETKSQTVQKKIREKSTNTDPSRAECHGEFPFVGEMQRRTGTHGQTTTHIHHSVA